MLIEKQLNELTVGHYVVKIAKQQGSFSLSAPGHIKSNAVISHLKSKKVTSVLIDESKTIELHSAPKVNHKTVALALKI